MDILKSSSANITIQEVKEEKTQNTDVPPVTTHTSEEYIRRLALANSRACATDPLNILFENEKLPQPLGPGEVLSEERLRQMIYESTVKRLTTKIANGAFLAEAGDFAAVACWEPESIHDGEQAYTSARHAAVNSGRHLYAEFLKNSYAVREAHLRPLAEKMSPDGKFWRLSLMARDPAAPHVKGAVRAVLAPFVDKFTSADAVGGPVPVWLEAGSGRSRVVYGHLGFREVGAWVVGGVPNWGMIHTGKPNSSLPE